MQDDEFGWRDAKATANWRDLGVSFHDAIKAFRDPLAIERIVDRGLRRGTNQPDRHVPGCDSACDLYGTRRPDLDHLGSTGNKT